VTGASPQGMWKCLWQMGKGHLDVYNVDTRGELTRAEMVYHDVSSQLFPHPHK
jgi:hypothetical protein